MSEKVVSANWKETVTDAKWSARDGVYKEV